MVHWYAKMTNNLRQTDIFLKNLWDKQIFQFWPLIWDGEGVQELINIW